MWRHRSLLLHLVWKSRSAVGCRWTLDNCVTLMQWHGCRVPGSHSSIMGQDNGVTTLTFGVTWRHRSRDHSTPHVGFPIGGQWWPGVYLARLLRYSASNISGSRPWPFVVTWRHRSRDHSTPHGVFPIAGQWWPAVYLARLLRYCHHHWNHCTAVRHCRQLLLAYCALCLSCVSLTALHSQLGGVS